MPPAGRYKPLDREGVRLAGEVRHMNDSDTTKTIKEAIDACRPGSDDVSLPEMSALAESLQDDDQVRGWYDRTQRSDLAIGGVFQDIPIPEGLSDRLVEAIQKVREEPGEESSSFVDEAVAEQSDLNTAASVAIPAARRKRWKPLAVVGASLAVIILACFFLLRPDDREITIGKLHSEVSEWIVEVAPSTDWNLDLGEVPAKYIPRDPALLAIPQQWCFTETSHDRRTIVYGVSRPGEKEVSAYVFCIHTKGRDITLPNVLPLAPQWTTGRVSIGAWQRNGMVYILAVQGGEQQYRSYIRRMEII